MRILNVDNNYQKASNKNPNFNAWQRTVYKPVQYVDCGKKTIPRFEFVSELQHRNDTLFFRDRHFWVSLSDFLVNKYKEIAKVNVYNYACSNGSETYTFIMSLLSHFKDEFTKKFFPILAKDYDKFAIERAKDSEIPISLSEVVDINAYTGQQFTRFFGPKSCEDQYGNANYPPKDELTTNVVFTQADVLEDCTNIEPNNSVVFVRNFWPYLSGNNQLELAQKLYSQLESRSTVVIGHYDMMDERYSKQADDLLRAVGFKEVENSELLGLVYEK